MFGLQEIIVVAGIVGALLFGPRLRRMLTEGQPDSESRRPVPKPSTGLSMALRLGIVASVFVPGVAAAYFTPWHGNVRMFLYIGLLPVIIGWSVWWVARGATRTSS